MTFSTVFINQKLYIIEGYRKELTEFLKNTSDKDFWIAKPQPGSEIKARFPYCVFEVKNFEGKLMNENHAYYTQRLK